MLVKDYNSAYQDMIGLRIYTGKVRGTIVLDTYDPESRDIVLKILLDNGHDVKMPINKCSYELIPFDEILCKERVDVFAVNLFLRDLEKTDEVLRITQSYDKGDYHEVARILIRTLTEQKLENLGCPKERYV